MADAERELHEYIAQWEKGEGTLKTQTDAARETMLSRINPKAAFADGRKILHDAATPKPGDGPSTVTATSVNYKELYPKKTAPAGADPAVGSLADSVGRIHAGNPASTQPVNVTNSNAPVLGPPTPRKSVDPSKLGSLGGTVDYLNKNASPKEPPKPSFGEGVARNIGAGVNGRVDGLIQEVTRAEAEKYWELSGK